VSSNDDLGKTFGTAGVAGLAGRLPRIDAPPAPPPAQPTAPPVAAPVAAPIAPPVAEPLSSGDSGTKQITVYVLPHVPEAIRADKQGRTNAAVVYDAIEARHRELPTLLAGRRVAPTPATGGLFARQAADIRHDEPQRVPWTFKATPDNRAVLDRLATSYHATSRSELVSVALEATYPPPPEYQASARAKTTARRRRGQARRS